MVREFVVRMRLARPSAATALLVSLVAAAAAPAAPSRGRVGAMRDKARFTRATSRPRLGCSAGAAHCRHTPPTWARPAALPSAYSPFYYYYSRKVLTEMFFRVFLRLAHIPKRVRFKLNWNNI